MKIFITGITGLLGSYLAAEFFVKGEIHGLRRKHSDLRLLGSLASKIIWHEGEIDDAGFLEEAFLDMDLIIHSAALVSYDNRDEDSLMKINVEGTTNVVNAMLTNGNKNLIHISSVAALGRTPGLTKIDENHKWVESEYNTPYAISKYHAELEVWRGVQEGIQALVVNPALVLGKISDQRSSTQIYDYVLNENKYFPAGTVNYIDVRDAAKMVLKLFDNNIWNERFILSASALPYKDFFGQMATVFGKKPPSKAVNKKLLQVGLFFLSLGRLLKFTQNPLNKQTAMISQMKVEMDNTKVLKQISHNFYSLKETLIWANTNEKQNRVV